MAQSTGPAVSPLFSTGTSARSCLHLSTWARSCNRLKSSLINCLLSCVIALFSMVAQDWHLWSTDASLCRYICVCSPIHLRDAALLISSGSIAKKRQERDSVTWTNGSVVVCASLPDMKGRSLTKLHFILLLISLKATLVFNTCKGTIIWLIGPSTYIH